MKGKPAFKLPGLKAKRWREASQTRGPADWLPPSEPPKKEVRRKKGHKQQPYEQPTA